MTNLNISESDFSKLKENFKSYLKNQDIFNDYNFSGSGLSILLDVLAYNSTYMTMYANLALSETFLDSAVQRNSVVSRAKEIGYLPRSKTAARAAITISFTVSGNPDQYVIPKNTKFSSTIGNISYAFVTDKECMVDNVNNTFSKTLNIHQGKFVSFQYEANANDTSQRFVVPSLDVDKNFLTVLLKDNNTSPSWVPWESVDNVEIGDLNSDNKVYFLKEAFDGFYEVYFGDGIIGKKLQNGNLVRLEYLITEGPTANNSRTFSLSGALPGTSNVSILTVDISSGGAEKESVESIKFLAPFFYQSQARAVTENDYKALIKNKFSQVDDVAVWGGEKNDPPFYGKVFISIKPTTGDTLSANLKQTIGDDIVAKYNVIGIRPEIVDPDYTKVIVSTVVSYNSRLFNNQSGIDLEGDIRESIESFFDSAANKFGKPLYYSKLVGAIESASNLIVGSITNTVLEKNKKIFSGNTAATYVYKFNNSLTPGSILSNNFVSDNVTVKIKDARDQIGAVTGTLKLYKVSDGTFIKNIGIVDYNLGDVTIVNIRISNIIDDPVEKKLKIQVSPGPLIDINNPDKVFLDDNIYTNSREQIIVLKDTVITLIPDNTV